MPEEDGSRLASNKRKLRTLLFSSLYPSSIRPGHGIFVETRLRELLGSSQVETRVVSPVPWFFSTNPRFGEYALIASTPARERHHGIDVLHPRYFLPPRFGMTVAPLSMAIGALPAIRTLQDEGFDFDLIDAHYFYPDGVAAAILAKWLHKPYVVTARGTDLNLIPQHALPRRMIEWAARGAVASIGVCAALVDVLRAWGLPDQQLLVMRNGVDLQRFRPMPQEQARSELGIRDGPVLLSVGYLIERKRHHVAIRALAKILPDHPDARLLIVGDGPDLPALIQLARELGLAERVTFAGAQPNADLFRWYSAADALLLASSREGWANVLLESMACGTPVVATRIWGTPEVVAKPVAGRLIDDGTPELFAHAIILLLNQYPDRREVRTYAEGFSWQATTDAQLRLFNRVAASRG